MRIVSAEAFVSEEDNYGDDGDRESKRLTSSCKEKEFL